MHGSSHRYGGRGQQSRGPETFYGYCQRSKQYRMMDLPDFMENTQAGMSQMMADGSAAMQRMWSPGSGGGGGTGTMESDRKWRRHHRHGHGHHHGHDHDHQHDPDCGCDDDCGCGGTHGCSCHCDCCVCDADVLVHARCGEVRRIPLTFENDTRRDKPVTLTLEKFVTSGGRDLGWNAVLSEAKFTLHPCDEHTVSLLVRIVCKPDGQTPQPNPDPNPTTPNPNNPNPNNPNPNPGNIAGGAPGAVRAVGTVGTVGGRDDILGSVDRCEVGYATIRAEGCLTRPIVVAIAVLPDDCETSRHGCGCGCCND
jgi:hypothetical protein